MDPADHILLGVAGSPVFHSKSPDIFDSIFIRHGINGSYLRLAVSSPGDAIRLLKEIGFLGMNITAPYKASVIPYLDSLCEDAETMGSVNTVVSRNGKLTGYNTDHYGVSEPLEKAAGSLKGKNAVVAGAGGAGISAAFGLLSAGCRVTILNITPLEAEMAAKRLGCSHGALSSISKLAADADIIVSALPYEADHMDLSQMKQGSLFMDASYRKSRYPDISERYGVTFVPGEEWLIHQAVHACSHFLGFLPEIETVSGSVSTSRPAHGIISLIGFMASGKSAVGKELARIRKSEFIDLDELIEQKTSMKIKDIFSRDGEKKFREIETEILHSLKSERNLVLSCGGGVILDEKNREFLTNHTDPVWLYCGMSSVVERASDGSRPLINSMQDPFIETTRLFNSRKKFYASTCRALVLSEGTPLKTAELINEEIRLSI